MNQKKSLKVEFKESWLEFRKQCTWNAFRGLLSAVLPLCGWMYLYSQWMKLVSPLLDEFSKSSKDGIVTMSQHDAIISLCVLIGFVAPLFFSFPVITFGSWLGRVTKFYTDNKTVRVWWDDKYYFVRDMPEEEREMIKELLTKYKSKTQLRKESKVNQSWFRRNFT